MIETPTIIELGFVLLTSLLSSGVSYYLGKRKSGREDFDTLITANEQFRSEIRKDLIEARKTVEEQKIPMLKMKF